MSARELLGRTYGGGTIVTNCVKHIGMPITRRPDDCQLCAADIRNTLSRALGANEWLNTWKDDATPFLEQAANDGEAPQADGERGA